MTDPNDPNANQRFDIGKMIVISGWAITLLVSVSLIMLSLWLIMHGLDVPSPLKEWSGIAIGFLFGNLMTMIFNFTLGKTT